MAHAYTFAGQLLAAAGLNLGMALATCIAPSILAVTNVSAPSATIAFVRPSAATAYTVVAKSTGARAGSALTRTSATSLKHFL